MSWSIYQVKPYKKLLTENKIVPLDSLFKIISQVCIGLQEAHKKGIVHRDLKPDNIFLVSGGAFGEVVKIIDFGIAKNLNSNDQNLTQLTQEGSFIGTYRYASPEQCRGLTTIDQRTDIYSLGVILYEAICGKNPYDLDDSFRTSEADWIACHIQVRPKPLKEQAGCDKISDELENIVMKCLAKSPQERFSNLEELQQALSQSFLLKEREETIKSKRNNYSYNPNSNNKVAEKNLLVTPQSQNPSSRRKVLKYGSFILGGIALTVLLARILKPSSSESPKPKLKFDIEPLTKPQITSSGEIWSLAISPDGKFIASGNNHGLIELYNRQTKEYQKILDEDKNVIRALVFIPNTNQLISGDGDGRIKVWNRKSNSLEKQLQGHSASIWSLAISPDGQILVSSSEDKSIRIWNLTTGETKGIIFAHNTVVYTLAFSHDGQVFASAGKDKSIKIWDALDRTLVKSLEGHQDTVRAIAFSPDGQYLVSGSWDKTVKVWQLESGELIATLEGHQDRVVTVAISRDSQTVFSGSIDNTIKVWSIKNTQLITTLSQHDNWVLALATSRQENLLASGSKDSTVKLWQYSSMNLDPI